MVPLQYHFSVGAMTVFESAGNCNGSSRLYTLYLVHLYFDVYFVPHTYSNDVNNKNKKTLNCHT